MNLDPDAIIFVRHYGHRFTVHVVEDVTCEAPWHRVYARGAVREVSQSYRTSGKRPGERELPGADADWARYYDVQGMQRSALAESWGLPEAEMTQLQAHTAQASNRAPTKREIAARAVEGDYQRMRAWCLGEWRYIGLEVVDALSSFRRAQLYGIPSDETDYQRAVMLDLCTEADPRDELERQVQRARGALALVFEDE